MQKLVITISSRALFDLTASNAIFEQQGVAAYANYQIAHENEILAPGVAFNLVKKLLHLNQFGSYVEVILLSKNSADTGLRIFKSIEHYKLPITRAVFTSGTNPYPYVSAFKAQLFLSADPQDVRAALHAGCAAATILPTQTPTSNLEQLRIAFDGDAVLFSDAAERIFQEQGIEAFSNNEILHAKTPLPQGPLHGFFKALHALQQKAPIKNLIRTALVTSRSAPAHERVVRTFRAWGIHLDEVLFLGGLDKKNFLLAFNADIFFDDQHHFCNSASKLIATGHVPNGCKNPHD